MNVPESDFDSTQSRDVVGFGDFLAGHFLELGALGGGEGVGEVEEEHYFGSMTFLISFINMRRSASDNTDWRPLGNTIVEIRQA